MKQELLDAAFAALDALIADEGTIKDSGRYIRMSKLVSLADKLRQMAITRVADVDPAYVGAIGYDLPDHLEFQDAGGGVNLGNYMRPAPRDNPMGDMLRLVSEQFDKIREDKAKDQSDSMKLGRLPRTSVDIAYEIEQLLRTRNLVTGRERLDIIDRRVDQLLKTIDKETNNDPAADDSNVVPSLVLRGHSHRGDGGEDLRPGDVEGDARGERRVDRSAQDGREEAVGHGG